MISGCSFHKTPGDCLVVNHLGSSKDRFPGLIGAWVADFDPLSAQHGQQQAFSFIHEVQPVLDRYCVGCHNPEKNALDGRPDFSEQEERGHANFNKSYLALHPYVRRPGPESDYHAQIPLEWHADTSELMQMLRKGHKGVELSDEAWDRLITWIDLNVPDHGRWTDHRTIPNNFDKRRAEMRALYSNMPDYNEEAELVAADYPREFIRPEPPALDAEAPELEGWPFDNEEARARQAALDGEEEVAERPAHLQRRPDEGAEHGPVLVYGVEPPFADGEHGGGGEGEAQERFPTGRGLRLLHGGRAVGLGRDGGDGEGQKQEEGLLHSSCTPWSWTS